MKRKRSIKCDMSMLGTFNKIKDYTKPIILTAGSTGNNNML